MTRLDKLISRELNISRNDAKALIKKGCVTVNGAPVTSSDFKCGDGDSVEADGKTLSKNEFVYIMMNKPAGYVSATDDKREKTVLDLLPEEMKRRGLFPAGRLDKDTTGFMLITDDGAFAHGILSPKRHVDKTYIANLDKPFDNAVKADFENGMELGNEKLLHAELRALNKDSTVAEVVLREGQYHQVKRMFKKHGITVTALKRTAIGGLSLDEKLGEGGCRYITADELEKITLQNSR
ncbi:MAG: rRNA pseudouridine synthase [Eubacterium sp.]|nr:rRNA pseudouridine synthase [Eubacterium sp.]